VVRIPFCFYFILFFLFSSSPFIPLLPLTSWEAQDNTNMAEERTLKEYANPYTEEPHTIIVYPTVEGD